MFQNTLTDSVFCAIWPRWLPRTQCTSAC